MSLVNTEEMRIASAKDSSSNQRPPSYISARLNSPSQLKNKVDELSGKFYKTFENKIET